MFTITSNTEKEYVSLFVAILLISSICATQVINDFRNNKYEIYKTEIVNSDTTLLLSSKTKRIMKLFIICFIILFSSCGVYIPHKRVNELYNMIPGKAFYEIIDSIPTKSERKVVKEYLNHYRYYQY